LEPGRARSTIASAGFRALAEGLGFVDLPLAQPLHGHVFEQEPCVRRLRVQLQGRLKRLDRIAELTPLPLSRGRLDKRRQLACPLQPGRCFGSASLSLGRLAAIPHIAAQDDRQRTTPAVTARGTGSGHQPRLRAMSGARRSHSRSTSAWNSA
jgi:hypothetical protein